MPINQGSIPGISAGLRGVPKSQPSASAAGPPSATVAAKRATQPDHQASDFLLPPDNESDDFSFRPPVRSGGLLTPIRDGVATFKAMEGAIWNAKEYVYLTFWFFQLDMPLQSDLSLKTWEDLLWAKADHGVDVRLLLSDFDPVFQTPYHEGCWKVYNRIADKRKSHPDGSRHLEILCSRHPATINSRFVEAEWLQKFRAIAARLTTSQLQNVPGLWLNLESTKSGVHPAAHPDSTIFPFSHHQKAVVIDGTLAIAGGIDPAKGRIDDPSHDAHLKWGWWHDMDCSIQGSAVADVERNFAGRWNHEAQAFRSFVSAANGNRLGVKLPILPVSRVPPSGHGPPPRSTAGSAGGDGGGAAKAPGKAVVQILRTVTEDALGRAPHILRQDVEESWRQIIGAAESFVYIENQYMRAQRLGDWLIGRWKEKASLQIIIVLPIAPEEAQGHKEKDFDPITKHGLFLQHQLLSRLQREITGGLGIFSLSERATVDHSGAKIGRLDTDSLSGHHQIYVHSKTMIVDDAVAVIGSANTNLRSMEGDTELNVGWFEPASVAGFRKDLWNELLGSPSDLEQWDPTGYADRWKRLAVANTKLSGSQRHGFIEPYDFSRFKGERFELKTHVKTRWFDVPVKAPGSDELVELLV